MHHGTGVNSLRSKTVSPQRDFSIGELTFGLNASRDLDLPRFNIQRSTTWIRCRAQFRNHRFEVGGPVSQGGSYLGVSSRLGELEQRLRVTLEIISTDHDGRPHSYQPKYIMQEPDILFQPKVQK